MLRESQILKQGVYPISGRAVELENASKARTAGTEMQRKKIYNVNKKKMMNI